MRWFGQVSSNDAITSGISKVGVRWMQDKVQNPSGTHTEIKKFLNSVSMFSIPEESLTHNRLLCLMQWPWGALSCNKSHKNAFVHQLGHQEGSQGGQVCRQVSYRGSNPDKSTFNFNSQCRLCDLAWPFPASAGNGVLNSLFKMILYPLSLLF